MRLPAFFASLLALFRRQSQPQGLVQSLYQRLLVQAEIPFDYRYDPTPLGDDLSRVVSRRLLDAALSAQGSERRRARTELEERLGSEGPAALIELDRALRDSSWNSPLNAVRRGTVARFQADLAGFPRIFGLLASHPDGHIREEAVRILARSTDGTEIGYLALRSADWVEPVRRLAWNALRQRFDPLAVGRMLGLFKCLAQSPRPGADQAWLEAKRLFAAPENFAALEAVYQTAKQSQHRKACLEAVSPEQEGLWRLALADRDPLLQIFALKQVKGRAGFADEARSLLSARLGMVRRAALSAWMEGAFQGSPPDLEAFLLDRDSGVRELALYYAKQTGKPDPRAVYEGALRSEKPRLIAMAIEGLASLGLWEALPPLQPLAEGGDSLLECAALRALALKKDTADRDLFWKKVLGPPTAASRIACNALRSRYASVSLDELRQLARMDGPKHHLRQARRQTGQLKTWDQVLFWLEGMASPDPDHARVCGSRLKTWIDKGSASAAELEPGQRLALREALAKVKRGFSGGQEEILRFIIG